MGFIPLRLTLTRMYLAEQDGVQDGDKQNVPVQFEDGRLQHRPREVNIVLDARKTKRLLLILHEAIYLQDPDI